MAIQFCTTTCIPPVVAAYVSPETKISSRKTASHKHSTKFDLIFLQHHFLQLYHLGIQCLRKAQMQILLLAQLQMHVHNAIHINESHNHST